MKLKILLIEEDAELAELTRFALARSCRHTVFVATNLQEAAKFHEMQSLDMILADKNQCSFSGYDIVETLAEKKSLGRMPVILLDNENRFQPTFESLPTATIWSLYKPSDLSRLPDAIESIFSRHLSFFES